MDLTVEISMYPLADDYIPAIDDFIALLNGVPGVKVVTTPTSTRLQGQYTTVMALLGEAMAASHARFGKAVFVTKFIPGYAPD